MMNVPSFLCRRGGRNAVNWLYGGYFCGWYVLLGVGFVAWLTDGPGQDRLWRMMAFGAFAYFLVIPSLDSHGGETG